jgi:hypothetical protein
MTRFAIVKPQEQKVEYVDHTELLEVLPLAGLSFGSVDFGQLSDRDAIVVYEFSLFVSPIKQHYFSIDHRLYAGNAVIYGFDEEGVTVDCNDVPAIVWFNRVAEIEFCIWQGSLIRPQMMVNGEVFWRWPNPAPPGTTIVGD